MALKEILKNKKISQVRLATIADVSLGTVIRACSGDNVSLESMEKISAALNVPLADVYTDTEKKAEEPIEPRQVKRKVNGRRVYLEKILKQKGLSQAKIAEVTGLSPVHINGVIAGRHGLTMKTLRKLSNVLDLDMSLLLALEEEKDFENKIVCPHCGKIVDI